MSFKKKLKKYSILLLGFSSLPMLTACYGNYYDESYFEDFQENIEQVEGAETGEVADGTSTETE